MTAKEPRIAAVFLMDGFNALEAIGFAEAISLLPDFRCVFVADKAGAVSSDSGDVTLNATVGLDDVESAEVLMVPGGRVVPLLSDERTCAWIRSVDATTGFTAAMCLGRGLLGAAGLLEGVRVAAQPVPLPSYGAIEVAMRLVADGKIVTGANASSSIDLGLYVAAQYTDVNTVRAIQVSLEYDVDVWGPPFEARALPEPGPEELTALMGLVSTGARAEIVREIYTNAGVDAPI